MSTISGLTATQWGFIAARLVCDSDTAAAKAVGINPTTVPMWKRENPDFVREYEAAFADGLHVAREYSRKLLGKAVQRHNEGLDANRRDKADHATRLAAARNLLQIHGLLKNQQVHSGDPDNPIQNEMVVTIVRSGGRTRISHTGTTPGAGADSEPGETV